MFKSWESWLGVERENDQVKQTSDEDTKALAAAQSEQTPAGVLQEDTQTPPAQLAEKAKDFSGYIYNFASSATKKLSESVVETAHNLKKSVEEGNITGIIDKTILGDFQKEQQKFVEERKAKQFSSAVPPWVGCYEEDTIQQQTLALSADKRNFLREPPAGVQFHFDFEQMYPVAMVMLEEDELLRKMRFHLVPNQVKEEVFWKNYFYRVSLIKQSAQLTALAAQQAFERKNAEKTSSFGGTPDHKDVVNVAASSALCNSKTKEDEEEFSVSPSVAEFASDAFGSCEISKEDLFKEMEQLVLDKKDHSIQPQEETEDWEKELQEELQEYDVLADGENRDDGWDQEIEAMLKEDSKGD